MRRPFATADRRPQPFYRMASWHSTPGMKDHATLSKADYSCPVIRGVSCSAINSPALSDSRRRSVDRRGNRIHDAIARKLRGVKTVIYEIGELLKNQFGKLLVR